MKKLSIVSYEELKKIIDDVKNTIEIKGADSTGILNERMSSYIPNLSFKEMIEFTALIEYGTEEDFYTFKENHLDLMFDETGNSKNNWKWWEPLIEIQDALYKYAKTNYNKCPNKKFNQIIEAYELKEFKLFYEKIELLEDDYNKDLNFLFKMYHSESISKSDVRDVFKKLESKLVHGKLILKSLCMYLSNETNYEMINLIIPRLQYMLDDKNLKHDVNKNYFQILTDLDNLDKKMIF